MKQSISLTSVFKKGSTTYFYSSLIFPDEILEKVTRLYAFVRIVDDFVDQVPPQKELFFEFKKYFYKAYKHSGKPTSQKKLQTTLKKKHKELIYSFIELCKECSFELQWVDAFFKAMQQDMSKKTYKTLKQTDEYMYGSAQVIGLMMCQIFGSPRAAHHSAMLLGTAMQYTNFIRDISEDFQLGRQYIPTQISIEKAGTAKLSPQWAQTHPEAFGQLIQQECARTLEWYEQAAKGWHWIPARSRWAVMTATALYRWTLTTIASDPLIIWQRKVKPSKLRVLLTAGAQLFQLIWDKITKN